MLILQTRNMACRLVDRENRKFNDDWTELFFFHTINEKPVCLICSTTLAVSKKANISRHYKTNHSDYDGRFPLHTDRRRDQLQKLVRQSNGQRQMLKAATTKQEHVTTASYQVSYQISKAMAPYKHSELIKDCLIGIVGMLFPDKPEIKQTVQNISLSRNACTRRVEEISKHLTNGLLRDLEKCDQFAIAVDESNDIQDVAQLCVFVRYFSNMEFKEELLAIIPLSERTTGKDIYDAFM